MNTYTANTLLALSVVITAAAGGNVDPTAVTLKVKTPSQEVVDLTPDIVHDGVGYYHADYLPTDLGLYQYEWIATGTVQVSTVTNFLVNQGLF